MLYYCTSLYYIKIFKILTDAKHSPKIQLTRDTKQSKILCPGFYPNALVRQCIHQYSTRSTPSWSTEGGNKRRTPALISIIQLCTEHLNTIKPEIRCGVGGVEALTLRLASKVGLWVGNDKVSFPLTMIWMGYVCFKQAKKHMYLWKGTRKYQ